MMNIFLNGHLVVLPEHVNGLKEDINIYIDKSYCKFSAGCIEDINKYYSTGVHTLRIKTKDEIFGIWKFSYSLWRALEKISSVVCDDPWIILLMSMTYTLLSTCSKLAEFYVRRFSRRFNNCINRVLNETFNENDSESLKEIFAYFGKRWSGEYQVSLMLTRIIDNLIMDPVETLTIFRGQLSGHLENIVVYKTNPIKNDIK